MEGANVTARLHFDIEANAKFVFYYLIPDASNPALCKTLATSTASFVTSRRIYEMGVSREGEAPISSNDLSFTGRIFIYHAGDIDAATQLDMVGLAKDANYIPVYTIASKTP